MSLYQHNFSSVDILSVTSSSGTGQYNYTDETFLGKHSFLFPVDSKLDLQFWEIEFLGRQFAFFFF